jgi:K+-transporting ATPase ATPase C chain
MSADQVCALVNQLTEGRTFAILGEPRVNVLKLNVARDGR